MTHRWWQFANVLGALGLCLGFLAVLIFVIGRFIHPEFMSDVTFAGALLNVLEGGLFFYVAAIITYFFAIPFFYDPNWKER